MTSRIRCLAIAGLFLASTGCRFLWIGRVKADPIPVPDPPRAVEAKAPPPKVEPPGPPPKIETKAPEVPSAVSAIPNPPAPKPKSRRQPRKPATAVGAAAAAAAQPPAAETSGPAAPPPLANVPKLGEILSDGQLLQLRRNCDESLGRAREALSQLRGLNLSPEQKQSLARIRIFIGQAEQARERDPQTAKQLAERADLLSRDLVRTVR